MVATLSKIALTVAETTHSIIEFDCLRIELIGVETMSRFLTCNRKYEKKNGLLIYKKNPTQKTYERVYGSLAVRVVVTSI